MAEVSRNNHSIFVATILVFLTWAVVFPAFAQYLFSFIALVYLIAQRLRGRTSGENQLSSPSDRSKAAGVLLKGILFYVGAMAVAALASTWASDWVPSPAAALRQTIHFVIKNGLVAVVLVLFFAKGLKRSIFERQFLLPLLVLFILNFAYLVLQRKTGIDLSHGWSATLPQHRFAYGVYRISGFMGHPLSLSFNLITLTLLFGGLAIDSEFNWTRKERGLLLGLASVAAAGLLISGSRWPLIVVAVTFLTCEGRLLWRWRWRAAGAGALIAIILFFEKSIIGRFGELIQRDTVNAERFERLVFWKVHWQMFLDNPWVGVGLAATPAAKVQYYAAVGYNKDSYNAHNIYLQTLADSGIVGALGLLVLLFFVAKLTRGLPEGRGRRPAVYLLVATVLGGIMQNTLRDTEYLFGLWLGFATIIALSNVRQADTPSDGRKPIKNFKFRPDREDPETDLSG